MNKMEMYVHSLKTYEGVHVLAEVIVLEYRLDSSLVVNYKGTRCIAIYNPFNGCHFADDLYGVISE